MAFFTSAVNTLQTLVIALGAGLGVRGLKRAQKTDAYSLPFPASTLIGACLWLICFASLTFTLGILAQKRGTR